VQRKSLRRTWRGACLAAVLPCIAPALAGQESSQPGPRRVALDEALAAAEAGSLDLQLARGAVDAARARVLTAGTRPNPTVALDREQLGGNGVSHETVLSVGQSLDLAGQRGARREAATREVSAAEVRVEAERARVGADVTRAYLRAATAEARLASLAEAGDLFRTAEQAGQVRFREGDISAYELQRLQLEAARYVTLSEEAAFELRQAGRELAFLLRPGSAPPGDDIVLPADTLGGIALHAASLAADTALARALRRADIRAAEADVGAARAAVDLRIRGRRPNPTLMAGLKEQAGGMAGAVVGVSVPLPLSDRSQGPIAEARAALAQAETRVAIARRAAEADVRRALERRAALAERLRLREGLLARARALLATARVAYAEGETSLLELLDAAETFRTTREGADALLAEYLTSVADLERATGGTDR
jgi:cobalt-zinc-cadmium efflux system outer membrane protein